MNPHEERIVGMILDGYTRAFIAKTFRVDPISIDVSLHRLYKKHECNSFVSFCKKMGWLKVSLPIYNSFKERQLDP